MVKETEFDIFIPFRRLNESLPLWSRIFVFTFLLLIGLSNECYAQAYAYVSNNSDNTVSVISISDNTVAATVGVGGGPWGIAIGASGDFVYVANNTDDTVSVIDTATFEVTETITVGDGPLGVTVAPSGDYVYVTNKEENTVSVIDVSDNTVAATVDVGGGPWGIAIGASGGYVYVANNADDTVSVIDTATFEVTETITVGDGPQGISITFDGGEQLDAFVYVANNTADTVTVINIVDNSILTNINVGNSPVALGNFIDGRPQPPSGFRAVGQREKISLSWSYDFTDAAGFILEGRPSTSSRFYKIADLSSDVTSYVDTNLDERSGYFYRITAYNAAGLSDYAQASATTNYSKGCFIATAAYGSGMAEEVKILKNFRDNVLLTNSLGRSLVKLYYKISTPVADSIAKHDSLRAMVRWSVLPLLGVSWLALKLDPVPALALIFLMITLIYTAVLVIFRKVRLGIHKI